MFESKLVKMMCASFMIMSLQPTSTLGFVLSFEMTDQGIDRAIRDYLVFDGIENIDKSAVDTLTEIVRDNSDIFNYIANSSTDPAFIPLLEKYSDLKRQFTGLPINAAVKVLFSKNPTALRDTNNNPTSLGSGRCDFFTRTVFIDHNFWEHYNNSRLREAVLFHELAHCDLSRRHEDDNPDSFMNLLLLAGIFHPDSAFYQDYKDELNISEEEINNMRMNLDRTFQIMTEELFSKENSCQNISEIDGRVQNSCVDLHLHPRSIMNDLIDIFKCDPIVVLRHTTIGPSQGENFGEVLDMQGNCIDKNRGYL